jgi:hypothetical protein
MADTEMDQALLDAGFRAVREFANNTPFGKQISDADCRKLAVAVVTAVEDVRSGKAI